VASSDPLATNKLFVYINDMQRPMLESLFTHLSDLVLALWLAGVPRTRAVGLCDFTSLISIGCHYPIQLFGASGLEMFFERYLEKHACVISHIVTCIHLKIGSASLHR
jgi:hypothetical protein